MRNRPKIIIKFAKSSDGFIGSSEKQVWLTNQFSKRLTHKWRSEIDGILVGKTTVLVDNPSLTTRFGFDKSPTRIILGKSEQIPETFLVKNGVVGTIFWETRNIPKLLIDLKERGLKTILVEGGSTIISAFLAQDLWDEARVFTVNKKIIDGIKAPKIEKKPIKTFKILHDKLEIFKP